MSSASFMPRPDIHGTLLGLFGFAAATVDEPEEVEAAPVKPEYDDRGAFEPAESCYCHIDPPCSYCVEHPEED